jgi:hypothetical protein
MYCVIFFKINSTINICIGIMASFFLQFETCSIYFFGFAPLPHEKSNGPSLSKFYLMLCSKNVLVCKNVIATNLLGQNRMVNIHIRLSQWQCWDSSIAEESGQYKGSFMHHPITHGKPADEARSPLTIFSSLNRHSR